MIQRGKISKQYIACYFERFPKDFMTGKNWHTHGKTILIKVQEGRVPKY